MNISAAILLGVIAIGDRSVTFTATSTGVNPDAPIEFVFAGKGSDRDYETLFILDDPISNLTAAVESAGIPRGGVLDPANCRFWPCGPQLTMKPSLDELLDAGQHGFPAFVYTGGTRTVKGTPAADYDGTAGFFACYDFPTAAILFDGSYPQGDVYGWYKARKSMKKGERASFTLSWDGKTNCKPLSVTFKAGNAAAVLQQLQSAAKESQIEVLCGFDANLTVKEAQAAAQALSVLDSPRVKVNGRPDGGLFYRAFLPLEKWRDRKERLTQPFEVTLGATNKIVIVQEDWSGEGMDPVLTPREFPIQNAKSMITKIDTAFIYASKSTPLKEIYAVMPLLPVSVRNWYIFAND